MRGDLLRAVLVHELASLTFAQLREDRTSIFRQLGARICDLPALEHRLDDQLTR